MPRGARSAAWFFVSCKSAAFEALSPEAFAGREMAEAMLADCDPGGALPAERRAEVELLVRTLETRLA